MEKYYTVTIENKERAFWDKILNCASNNPSGFYYGNKSVDFLPPEAYITTIKNSKMLNDDGTDTFNTEFKRYIFICELIDDNLLEDVVTGNVFRRVEPGDNKDVSSDIAMSCYRELAPDEVLDFLNSLTSEDVMIYRNCMTKMINTAEEVYNEYQKEQKVKHQLIKNFKNRA